MSGPIRNTVASAKLRRDSAKRLLFRRLDQKTMKGKVYRFYLPQIASE